MRGIFDMAIAFSDISFLKGDFDSEVTEFKEYSERKTGFDNIDDVQVFAPGLYVLGGATGAGKTTFALQLLCQLAARGSQCIFFSFEMSAFRFQKNPPRGYCRKAFCCCRKRRSFS